MKRVVPVVVLVFVVALCALAAPAAAHQSSVTYVEARVDGVRVSVSVRLAPRDIAEDLGGGDMPVEAAALIATQRDAIAHRVTTSGVEVQDGETPCPATEVVVAPSSDRIEVRFVAVCPAPPAELVLDYALVFGADRNHTAALRVHVAGQPAADTLLDIDNNRFSWRLGEAPPSGAVAFIRQGIHHVVTGLDHIAFVLALLLAIVIARSASGWELRGLGSALRATAATVSAFTVAHSLTLIAAALGYVDLPGRLVESVIAASIVFTAVADVVRPEARWRLATAFGFGLMHGLGFARMLAELLPPGDVVVPLLCFNLGVEIAQLGVVAVAVPAAWVLARGVGAERYRRVALPALAAPLVIFGTIWLIERVSDVTILGL